MKSSLDKLMDEMKELDDFIKKKNIEINEIKRILSKNDSLVDFRSDSQKEYDRERKEWDDKHGKK